MGVLDAELFERDFRQDSGSSTGDAFTGVRVVDLDEVVARPLDYLRGDWFAACSVPAVRLVRATLATVSFWTVCEPAEVAEQVRMFQNCRGRGQATQQFCARKAADTLCECR